jgi:hypothetical protein
MRVGRTSYPLYRLDALLKDVKIIYEKFGQDEKSREHIAEVLGQKIGGGGFTQKLADLRAYGLLTGRGKVKVTELGIKATFGTPQERDEALDKAVRNIDLWSAIYKKVGLRPNSETFWLDLVELTGMERPESQSKAQKVLKDYIEDARYLISVEKPVQPAELEKAKARAGEAEDRKTGMETPQVPMAPAPMAASTTGSVTGVGYIGFREYASVEIKDAMSYRLAKQVLNAIKKKLEAAGEKFEPDD